MREIDVEKWNRKKIFEWFKGFSNACWSLNKEIDVSKVVEYTKESKTSFFINFLFVVVKTLNDFECMRMRFVDGKVVVYDNLRPAYTVASEDRTYENVRHEFNDNYQDFYCLANEKIAKIKEGKVDEGEYNPVNCYNEYYISCLPWINFSSVTHPIPDDKSSQSIPRICWGKYNKKEDKFIMDFNITVNHMFCDGKDVSMFLLELEKNINNINDLIK